MAGPAAQLSAQLQMTKSLVPTSEWIQSFLNAQKANTPQPVLVQTALYRLLTSDFTVTLVPSTSTCFPVDIADATVRERKLNGLTIAAQVLAVEDMSRSRWEQIEALEALERGEGTKGREIIRVTATDQNEGQDGDGQAVCSGGGPHKLLLQDASGRQVSAIELRPVAGIGIGMAIGCKAVIKGPLVARGVVMMEPTSTSILGGKIEEMHKKWRDGRKDELRRQIEERRDAAG